ncbi:MAG: hypothetical protein H6924_10835 [Alphaproteobacteria bacterium]|nr:hypothetical protein [Alphaproteobacteria bacterium]
MKPEHKPRDENYRGGPVAMLRDYDANHDGILTRAELEAGLKAEFAAADTGHTGCLNSDQAAVINQKRQDEDKSTATPLIDWNRDGCIDYREFSAAPYSLFDQLDRDGDRQLTKKEMGLDKKPGDGGPGAGNAPDDGGVLQPEGRRRGPRGGPGGDDGPGGEPEGRGPGGGGPMPAVPN